MKKTALVFLSLLGSQMTFAQKYKTEPPVTVQRIDNWAFPAIDGFDGTYQFIVKEKKEFIFTDETFQLIDASRAEDQDVNLRLNPYLEVIILSKQKVNDPSAFRFTEIYKLN